MKRQKLARRKQQRNAALEERLAREAEVVLTPREDAVRNAMSNWWDRHPMFAAGFTKHRLASNALSRRILRGVRTSHFVLDETAPLNPFFAPSLGKEFISGNILDSLASIQRNQLKLPSAPDSRLRRATNLAATLTEVLTREVLGPCVSVTVSAPEVDWPTES